jgi:phage/plasmid-associated DNA primase
MFQYDLDTQYAYDKEKPGIKSTHVILDSPAFPGGRKYYVHPDYANSFMDQYCKALHLGDALCLAETAEHPHPFRIDIDIKTSTHPGKGEVHLYSMREVLQVIEVARQFISSIISSECGDEVLNCVVLEKTKYRFNDVTKEYKDGVHLQFPWLGLDTWVFEALRKWIEERVRNLLNSASSWVFDSHMYHKPWLMYGSSKDPSSEPYLATAYIGPKGEELNVEELFDGPYEQIKTKIPKRLLQPVKYYLPIFLSIKTGTKTPLSERFRKRKVEMSTRSKQVRRVRTDEQIYADIAMIRDSNFMELLSVKRATEYKSWMDVGWTLFNIGEGNEEGLDLWIQFSQRAPNFSPGECEDLWKGMEMRGKTFGSLWYMLEEDAPEEFGKWKNARVRNQLKIFTRCEATPGKLADLVVAMYKNRYVHATGKIWYEFSNHRWRKVEDAIPMKVLIYQDVRGQFEQYLKRLKKEKEENGEVEPEPEKKGKKQPSDLDRLRAVITKLEHPATLASVVEMCKLYLHDPKFVRSLDQNCHFVGCENGVLDLELKIFREGRPDDYISKSTGIYYKEYLGTEPELIELEELMHKHYPDEEIRKLVYDIWGMTLGGRNIQKLLVVSTGQKNCGKTSLHNLFKKSLGDYAIKSPAELIHKNNRNSSGSVRPELLRMDKVRANIYDEISRMEIDVDQVKRHTGNEEQWARTGYDFVGMEFMTRCVTFLQTNEPPKFPAEDDALWVRILIIQHLTQFLLRDDPHLPATVEEQWEQRIFPADVNFSERIPDLAGVLLWKIFNHYIVRTSDQIKIPEQVKADTAYSRSCNDPYHEFVHEVLEKMPKDDPVPDAWTVTVSEVFEAFQDWYATNYSKRKVRRDIFIKEIGRLFGSKPTGRAKVWKGWRIQQDSQPFDLAKDRAKGQ